MLKTSAMASVKSDTKRKQKDGVINSLRDLFGNILHIDIISSVASECDFDVERSSNVLLEMTNNIEVAPKPKDKSKKKSPQHNATSSPRKVEPLPKTQTAVVKSRKTQEYERVINLIRSGYKVLVILRGLPGSGKSRLATAITDVTLGPGNNSHHILSTDDFFMQQRGYVYDSSKLQEAHGWNHRRAFQAMSRGLSPVIIDNTNTQMWEMKPYAVMATDYGYIIEILEPDTWWVFNDKELGKRNSHNVPRAKIKDMLDRYEKNVTTQKLLCAYNLAYKFQKPPQYRLLPPVVVNNGFVPFRFQQQNGFVENVPKSKSTSALNQATIDTEIENLMEFSEIPKNTDQTDKTTPQNEDPDFWNSNPVDDILMCTEETRVEILQPNPINATSSAKSESKLFPDIENAWGVDEKALQSWDIVTPVKCDFKSASLSLSSNQEEAKPETRENSTCVEARDYLKNDEIPFGYRVVSVQTRDINIGSPARNFAPPKKTMIDQSCMTVDVVDEEENEEKRIKDLQDLFPKVPKSSLRELFHKCNRNFYWTVDLLLDDDNLGVANAVEEETEDKKEEQPIVVDSCSDEDKEDATKEKLFKRKTISEDSLELKTCLESKFDISKEHYSEHVYKVKQTKFGGNFEPEPQPSTSAAVNFDSESDSDEEDSCNNDDPKNMIELNLGDTFVDQLETLFGGDFPRGFQPVVQMPVALARQIYSFYVESICQQMEAQNHILDRLVKEDEDFARKLEREEVPELSKAPTFTEIMDEQLAMNLHKKDVDEWKNMTADNLAAKLTKQKLFRAFPSVEREILLEVWHAYNYDYNKTVEVLIASVGAENCVAGGIEEPPLSQNTLEEMKAAEETCGELEEPEVPKPATYYREEANKHLKKRAELYEKAKSYHQRGMKEVAMFYSELAKKETRSYDKANHFAAVAFIEEHSKRLQKFDTLDLHYFYVKEAIPNLDIFIDRNINLLKGTSKRGQDLFVITGRGKNSEGGRCKIKPAVMTRLKKRNIGFVQLNPGLLKIRVLRDSLITSDIP